MREITEKQYDFTPGKPHPEFPWMTAVSSELCLEVLTSNGSVYATQDNKYYCVVTYRRLRDGPLSEMQDLMVEAKRGKK